MEKNSQELLEELVAHLAEVRGQLDVIQAKVDELLNLKAQDAEEPGDIDIDHEDFLSDIAVEVPVSEHIAVEAEPAEPESSEAAVELPVPEQIVAETESASEMEPAEPVEAEVEPDLPEAAIEPDLPEHEPSESAAANEPEVAQQEPVAAHDETPEAPSAPVSVNADETGDVNSLFGIVEGVHKSHRKGLNDRAVSVKAVMDMKPEKPEWYTAIPGPEVKDIRSAISLNDRVMFITTLFRDDSMLFQDVVSKVNAMTSLDKVADYLASTFPEWDMYSDMVYRFMMAVRRKLR